MSSTVGNVTITNLIPRKFDYSRYIKTMTLRGKKTEYISARVKGYWLRYEYPNASIENTVVALDEKSCHARCTITFGDGSVVTDEAYVLAKDFGEYVEKALTKAMGRACQICGCDISFQDEDEEAAPVLPPVLREENDRTPDTKTWEHKIDFTVPLGGPTLNELEANELREAIRKSGYSAISILMNIYKQAQEAEKEGVVSTPKPYPHLTLLPVAIADQIRASLKTKKSKEPVA